MYVYSQKIAKYVVSYKRAGACWHYKKAVATAGNISAKNKLGCPLKKRIEPHPSWAISARKKQCPQKKEARKFLAP